MTQYNWEKEKSHIKKKTLSQDQFVSFLSQFGNMIYSGLSLIEIFDCMSYDENSRIAQNSLIWKNGVSKGKPLCDVFSGGDIAFPPSFISVIRAGEETGHLSDVLIMYTKEQKQIEEAERKLRSAITYPSMVIAISMFLLVLMFTIALPKLRLMFDSVGIPPKGFSGIIFGLSSSLSAIGVFPCFMIALAFDIWLLSPSGKAALMKFFSFIPMVKKIVHISQWSVFTGAVGIALSAGIPMIQSFEIARSNAPPELSGGVYDILLNGIAQGKSLTDIEELKIPQFMMGHLRVAERTGRMAETFLYIAGYYSNELKEKISTFSQSIEPVLMLLVIGIVGIAPLAVIKAMGDMYTTVLGSIGG